MPKGPKRTEAATRVGADCRLVPEKRKDHDANNANDNETQCRIGNNHLALVGPTTPCPIHRSRPPQQGRLALAGVKLKATIWAIA
jgi:hypothetical protein